MKSKLFEILLDFLLPPNKIQVTARKFDKNGLLGLQKETTSDICPFANALFPYKNKDVKNLIWALKYYKMPEIASYFGIYIYEHILSFVGENMYVQNFDSPILIPIPISSARCKERGFNQAELIARAVLKHDENTFLSLYTNILYKKSGAKNQSTSLSKLERKKNIANSFYAKNIEKIKDRNLIIIDDVITTGATLKEARKVLLESGARDVRAVAIAH